jgi:hypothetical protein
MERISRDSQEHVLVDKYFAGYTWSFEHRTVCPQALATSKNTRCLKKDTGMRRVFNKKAYGIKVAVKGMADLPSFRFELGPVSGYVMAKLLHIDYQ